MGDIYDGLSLIVLRNRHGVRVLDYGQPEPDPDLLGACAYEWDMAGDQLEEWWLGVLKAPAGQGLWMWQGAVEHHPDADDNEYTVFAGTWRRPDGRDLAALKGSTKGFSLRKGGA